MRHVTLFVLALSAFALIPGCGKKDAPEKKTQSSPDMLPSSLQLKTKPVNALSVVEARKQSNAGAKVILIGDIGGRVPPFIGNRAALILADETAITSCDKKHGDGCKTPWDYCCDTPKTIAESILTVQVLDSNGTVIKASLKGFVGLKELSKVIIVGTYDDTSTKENVIVNATGIYKVK